MSQLWVKVWVDSLGDVKVSRLSDHLWRRFYECVMLAGIRDEGGLLPSVDDCCWILHTNQELLEADFDYLAERGLTAKTDGGEWLVINWTKRQETPGAKRQRLYRERQKALLEDVTSNVTSDVTPARNIPASTSTSASTSLININKNSEIRKLFDLYEAEIGTITRSIAGKLEAAWDEYDHGWFELAFSEAAGHNARNWKYVEAILKRWKSDGFQSRNGKGAPARKNAGVLQAAREKLERGEKLG